MKKIINKIIAVEGLDKTGKSTFVDTFITEYNKMVNTPDFPIFKHSFPNANSPIGKMIRDELESLVPDPDIVSSPNFLAEMAHFWMTELFKIHYSNVTDDSTMRVGINKPIKVTTHNYIFDRYFISTLAYQAFYNDSLIDLEFIKSALNTNKFIKFPTDIIFLDLPNSIIIERTKADQAAGKTDSNDTLDEEVLDQRRDAYVKAFKFLKGTNVYVHWFEDVSLFTPEDLSKVLMGKIFK